MNTLAKNRAARTHAVRRRFASPPMSTWTQGAYIRALKRDPCAFCGGRDAAAGRGKPIDHIDPTLKPKPYMNLTGDQWDNLTALCVNCNGMKHTKSLLEALLLRRDILRLEAELDQGDLSVTAIQACLTSRR